MSQIYFVYEYESNNDERCFIFVVLCLSTVSDLLWNKELSFYQAYYYNISPEAHILYITQVSLSTHVTPAAHYMNFHQE